MKNRDDSMDWIPLWIDKWIFGSTRIELQPDERAVWVDLMAVASKDNGHVRANPTTPYPPQQLAGLLCITEDLLARTLQRCIQTHKIEEIWLDQPQNCGQTCGQIDQHTNNTQQNNFGKVFAGYRLLNWGDYQLSDRHKRRFESAKTKTSPIYNDMSQKTDTMSQKTDTIGEDRIGEDRILLTTPKIIFARCLEEKKKKERQEIDRKIREYKTKEHK